jgi:4-aminobutyrate aminotransferase / (S)-3-amino-2-methylpropionate transaminase / 5-aminovalerate transaminase
MVSPGPPTAAEETAALLLDEAAYSSHADTVHYHDEPKVFARCDGCFLFDDDGHPYLDLQMCYSAVNFGYRNSRLNEALKSQIDKLPQLAPHYLHRERVELAAAVGRWAERTFGLKGRVQFEVGGAQAVESAIKVVRNAAGGNRRIFAFEGAYHGRSLATSAISGAYRYRRRYGSFGDRAHFVPFPYCFRCPYGKRREECGLYCVDQFARLFESEAPGVWDSVDGCSEFSAFFIEPVQGTGGYVIPPAGYFEKLKKVLDAYGILLIDDEIQMGFFRTGKLWAIEHFNVRPDALVFGKALTNGLNPISGLWARESLLGPQMLPPGSTHSTFGANPLGTAVGLETLRMLDEDDYEAQVRSKGAYFLEGLRALKAKHPIIGDVDGLGLALRIEICQQDGVAPNKAATDRIVETGLRGGLNAAGDRYGLILDVGGRYRNVLTLSPSLTISYSEIDLAVGLLDQVFQIAGGT